jgi:glycosyltransferase involved in cell wall biosynthesis
MRILYVLAENLNRTGGGIVHFLAVARGLQRLGHTVFIMGPQYSASMNRPRDLHGIYVPMLLRSVATFLLFQLLAPVLFPFIVLLHRPEVVLVRGGAGVFWLLHLAARAFGVRVVLEANGVWWDEMLSRGFPPWLARLVRWSCIWQCWTAHRIISVTPAIGEELVRAARVPAERVFPIDNGADPSEFDPSRREMGRRRLSIESEAFVVGFVGSFAPWRGTRELVESARRLPEDVRRNTRYVLIGAGDLWRTCRRLTRDLGLGDMVYLPGNAPHPQVAEYLAAFDVGVLLTTDAAKRRLLGSPLKLWEYMAAGLPVLVSDDSYHRPLVETYSIGLMISDPTPEGIAAVVAEAYRRRRELAETGQRNRELVRRRFSWTEVSKRVAGVLGGREPCPPHLKEFHREP